MEGLEGIDTIRLMARGEVISDFLSIVMKCVIDRIKRIIESVGKMVVEKKREQTPS